MGLRKGDDSPKWFDNTGNGSVFPIISFVVDLCTEKAAVQPSISVVKSEFHFRHGAGIFHVQRVNTVYQMDRRFSYRSRMFFN